MSTYLPCDDSLLAKFVGDWHIARSFPSRTAENTARVDWVLDGHWLRITMKDVADPPGYEAHVYITRDRTTREYTCHWLDTFGGSVPDVLGRGQRDGDQICFTFVEEGGELRNTFAWHADNETWTSTIEQTDGAGRWTLFCIDTYSRPSRQTNVDSVPRPNRPADLNS